MYLYGQFRAQKYAYSAGRSLFFAVTSAFLRAVFCLSAKNSQTAFSLVADGCFSPSASKLLRVEKRSQERRKTKSSPKHSDCQESRVTTFFSKHRVSCPGFPDSQSPPPSAKRRTTTKKAPTACSLSELWWHTQFAPPDCFSNGE